MQEAGPGILHTDKDLQWKDAFVMFYEVEKGGVVSLDQLYMFMFHWFQKEQMGHWSQPNDVDRNIEDFYLHRMRADGVQENLIWWRACRRINRYTYYFCKMDWQNFGAKETEIEYQGKKVKTHKIGLVIRVWWWVQHDPFDQWEKSFLHPITEWFYEYLQEDELEEHVDKCRELAKRQENELKQFMDLTTSQPMPRSWFPEEGYKWDKAKPKPDDFANLQRKPDYKL